MSERKPDYLTVINNSETVKIKESGTRKRTEILNIVPEPENTEAESREFGQELQTRARKLLENYQKNYNLDSKKLISDDTIDYLFVRMDPTSDEYLMAHLIELDVFASRAEHEHRLLPMATKAIETWENLNGQRPTDFVNDGLRLDAHVFIDLKEAIEGFKNRTLLPGQVEASQKILQNFRKKYPQIMEIVESAQDWRGNDE